MMKWVMTGMVVLGVVFALVTGRISEVSDAFLTESSSAVELVLSLCGVICLWSGVMRVAQKSGITDLLAKLLSPLLKLLFKGLDPKGNAMRFISLNLTANILGLGNATTPFGLKAMSEIEQEEHSPDPEKASHNMIVFTVLNTASLQIIPTTALALRLKAGSADPSVILPAVWIVSALTLVSALTAAAFFRRLWERRGK